MEPQRLEIRDKNQFLMIKGKVVRTPLVVDITDEYELNRLKTLIKAYDFQDYSLRPIKEILEGEEEERKQKETIVSTAPKRPSKTKKTIKKGSTLSKMLDFE